MNTYDINPHIRFASVIDYKSTGNTVKCTDCRLYYILSGNAQIFIDNQSYTLSKNCVFFCCGNSKYNIVSEGVYMLCLNFDMTQEHNNFISPIPTVSTNDNIVDMNVFYNKINDSKVLSSHIMLSDGKPLYHKLNKIINEFSECKIFFRETSSAILKEILIQLTRHELPKSNVIDEIISYIHENYQNQITNKELADMAGYHEYHLNRLFTNHTGKSIHNYILNTRLNQAKLLIVNSDYSLSEIANKTGFNNYTYFSSYFKQSIGVTPMEYKKNMKNKA